MAPGPGGMHDPVLFCAHGGSPGLEASPKKKTTTKQPKTGKKTTNQATNKQTKTPTKQKEATKKFAYVRLKRLNETKQTCVRQDVSGAVGVAEPGGRGHGF